MKETQELKATFLARETRADLEKNSCIEPHCENVAAYSDGTCLACHDEDKPAPRIFTCEQIISAHLVDSGVQLLLRGTYDTAPHLTAFKLTDPQEFNTT